MRPRASDEGGASGRFSPAWKPGDECAGEIEAGARPEASASVLPPPFSEKGEGRVDVTRSRNEKVRGW